MYGKFPEFFRKKSGKFPTFYFSGKLTTLVDTGSTRVDWVTCVGNHHKSAILCNINNNSNRHDSVYAAIIMAQQLREFTRIIFTNAGQRQVAVDLWTIKPIRL